MKNHQKIEIALKKETAEQDQEWQRLVYAEVYAPNRPDSDREFMSAETIQKAAHDFVKNGLLKNVDVEHNNKLNDGVQIVESFIARKGDPDFIAGSWVVGVHIDDDEIWQKVLDGEINGFSLEAMVVKEETELAVEMPPVVSGKTSKSEDHEHRFFVTYDAEGNFLGGKTDVVDQHFHEIRSGTVTQAVKMNGKVHSHRFSSVDDIEIVR